jgi:phage shock protein A
MNALFGKKAQKPTQDHKDLTLKTIVDLDKKIGEMEEKIKFIEVKKNNLTEQAKTKLKSGDKNGARQALAKKKKYDEQIKQFDGALMLMEEQKMMLESAESMKSIFETIKNANSAIKDSQKDMNPDDLLKVKDDLEVIFNLIFI